MTLTRLARALALALATTLCASTAPAAFTTTYSFASLSGVTATVAADAQPAGGSASNINRNGLTAVSAAGGFNSSGWSTSTTLGGYLNLVLTAATGNSLSLSSLDFFGYRSATGPMTLDVRSSVDGFATSLLTSSTTASTAGGGQQYQVNFNSAAFSNLVNPVELRIYGLSAGGTAGTFRLTSTLTVAGSFNPLTGPAVPEPASIGLLGLGLMGVAVAGRRHLIAS